MPIDFVSTKNGTQFRPFTGKGGTHSVFSRYLFILYGKKKKLNSNRDETFLQSLVTDLHDDLGLEVYC